ncbi:hypothetical protein H6S82_05740 [Planktothrix sp. FACHB-1355]|uniref:Tetratricopeptide repeat protein n=1 Tax=Aerosakkonema funiforme FACHB-1375 TaxID=2949571 RepID=A0A926VJV2_9CYAN|nr:MULTISPECIES: hypothetical protein [Oscillatoriales]MBD2185059.1 hypothetical protein [Aerosakkonema funiforme FACHB-1375]MBD3558359.1 hypothetical protein [Planktothrix sp. FACHB-1355]
MTVSASYHFDEFVSKLLADTVVAAKNIKDARIKSMTLCRIALHYARFEQQNQALDILFQALNTAKDIKQSGNQVKAMGELAGICLFEPALQNQVDEILTQALQVAQNIGSSQERDLALAEIAFRYASAEESARAMQVLDLVGESSTKNYAKSCFDRSLIDYYIDLGKHDRAIELISESETICSDDKLAMLTSISVDSADLEQFELVDRALTQAMQILFNLNDCREKVLYLAEIAEGYSLIGYRDRAIQILMQALDAIKNIQEENTEDRAYMLAKIADGFALAGQPDYALQIAETIENTEPALYWKVDALDKIAGAYVEAGQIERANAALFEAFELANSMPNPNQQKAYSLIQMAEKSVKSSRIDRVAELLSQAFEITQSLKHSKEKYETQLSIVFWYKEAVLYDRALEIAIHIEDRSSRNKALNLLASSYIDAGKLEDAVQLLETIDDPVYRCEPYSKIAAKHTKSGQIKQGLEMFAKAVAIAKSIKNRRERQLGLIQVITSYMNNCECSYIVEIVEIVKTIKNASLETYLLTRIVYFYNQSGQETKVIYLYPQIVPKIERMKDSPAKTSFMAGIYSGYAKAGQYNQALDFVRKIKHPETKVQALLDIVDIYAAVNSH